MSSAGLCLICRITNRLCLSIPPARPREIAEFREIFNLVDLDHGGSIDAEELGSLMDLLGMNATEDEIEAMVNEIDTTGEGEIEFRDFVTVMSKKVDSSYHTEEVVRAFKKFAGADVPTGFIEAKQLEELLAKAPDIDAKLAAQIVMQMEPGENGLINFVQYINMMLSDTRHTKKDGEGKGRRKKR